MSCCPTASWVHKRYKDATAASLKVKGITKWTTEKRMAAQNTIRSEHQTLSRMESFECTLCYGAKTQATSYNVDGGPVCNKCIEEYIVPLFEAALNSEASYPVRWGPVELEVTAFRSFLGDEFISRYRQRAAEYAVPATDRIYCAHHLPASIASKALKGSSATEQLVLTPEQLADAEVECGAMVGRCSAELGRKLMCYHCRGRVCAVCEVPLVSITQGHDCRARPQTDRLARSVEAEGLTRGRDFQFCPKPRCGAVIGHDKGCNHMTCKKCSTSFCFLCGEEANREHWPAKCPLFGLPEAQDALPEGVTEPPPGLPEIPEEEQPEAQPAEPRFFTQPLTMMRQIRARSHLIRSMPAATRFTNLTQLGFLMHEQIEQQSSPLASIADDAVREVIEMLRVRDEEIQALQNSLPFAEVARYLPLLSRVIWFYAEYRQRLFVDVVNRLEALGELTRE